MRRASVTFLSACVLFCSGSRIPEDATELILGDLDPFRRFMSIFSKSYSDESLEAHRDAFYSNLAYIEKRNKDKTLTFSLGVTEHADLTFDEFKRRYAGGYQSEGEMFGKKTLGDVDTFEFGGLLSDDAHARLLKSASIDYRQLGCVSAVIDQGQCSSCWAFAAAASLEGNACVSGFGLTPLSAQNLVDCSRSGGNMGCRGGRMDVAYNYIRSVGGLCSKADYPYTGRDGQCQSCTRRTTLSQVGRVTSKSENAVARAVETYGPVSVAIQSASRDLQLYRSGVFNGQCGPNLDHAVLVVGFGNENGQDYWLIKNTWGEGWGDRGFVKFLRNSPQRGGKCGIAEDASFPVVPRTRDPLSSQLNSNFASSEQLNPLQIESPLEFFPRTIAKVSSKTGEVQPVAVETSKKGVFRSIFRDFQKKQSEFNSMNEPTYNNPILIARNNIITQKIREKISINNLFSNRNTEDFSPQSSEKTHFHSHSLQELLMKTENNENDEANQTNTHMAVFTLDIGSPRPIFSNIGDSLDDQDNNAPHLNDNIYFT